MILNQTNRETSSGATFAFVAGKDLARKKMLTCIPDHAKGRYELRTCNYIKQVSL
jgi:hypothetical protein